VTFEGISAMLYPISTSNTPICSQLKGLSADQVSSPNSPPFRFFLNSQISGCSKSFLT